MSCEEKVRVTDKSGRSLTLSYGRWSDLTALVDMYERFTPKAITQGLPPIDSDARFAWVETLVNIGENFLVWQDAKVIGHASLIPDSQNQKGEYVIFVDHTFRNAGLGTQLTVLILEKARQLGLKSIWLTVEALNFRAIKLYKKFGFVFCDSGERERTMMLTL